MFGECLKQHWKLFFETNRKSYKEFFLFDDLINEKNIEKSYTNTYWRFYVHIISIMMLCLYFLIKFSFKIFQIAFDSLKICWIVNP